MFGSEVLDTAIGLVFVFLLVSMLVTVTNELISAVLLSRAKWLRYGMERLLGSEWAAKLYSHPLVEGSSSGTPVDSDSSTAVAGGAPAKGSANGPTRPNIGSGPSYLSSRAFTDVLLHFVQREDAVLSKVMIAVRAQLASPGVDTLPGAALHDAVTRAAKAAVPDDATTSVVSDLARFLKERRDLFVASLLSDLRARITNVDDTLKKPLLDELDNLAAVQKDLAHGAVQARLTAAIARIHESAPDDQAMTADGATSVGDRNKAGDLQRLVADLTTMVGRIDTGYTVGNAVADIQRFVADIPTNYLLESIDRIPDLKVRKTLHTLLDDAGRDVEHFKRNIEVWFNNAMDRVSGWYKRQSQWVVGGLCIVAAVGLNVDAIAIVDYLQTNAGVRDALVAKAKAFSDKNATTTTEKPDQTIPVIADQLDTVRSDLTGLKLPIGWKWPPDAPGKAVDATKAADAEMAADAAKRQQAAKRDPYRLEFSLETLPGAIGFHWLGWFITALAATLGAPFWFDTLNRVISIRSAGKSPEEKPRKPKVQPQPLAPGQAP